VAAILFTVMVLPALLNYPASVAKAGAGSANASRYNVTAPAPETASKLTSFDAVEGTHYTLTSTNSGWTNGAFVVSAKGGYLVSKGSTATGTWAQELTLSNSERDLSDDSFYVKNTANGEISRIVTVKYGIDITVPTGNIIIKTNKFKTFINTISFDLFFKKNVDVDITGADTDGTVKSGVYSVEYLKLDSAAAAAKGITVGASAWSGAKITVNNNELLIGGISAGGFISGDSFGIPADWKGTVFARITDKAGNAVIINSDGLVVYRDCALSGSLSYEKTTMLDKSFNVTLNGNSIDKVYLCNGSGTTFNPGAYPASLSGAVNITSSDYTISQGNITLNGTFLETLSAGDYTVIVTLNPMEKTYKSENGGDDNTAGDDEYQALEKVKLELYVTKATPMVTWPQAADITYGMALSESALTGGFATGGGTFTWPSNASSIYPKVTNPGYVVTLTPSDTDSYDYSLIGGWNPASKTVTKTFAVAVKPLKLTGATTISDPKLINGFSASDKLYDGNNTASVTFTPNNLVSGDSVASVVGAVTAHFAVVTAGTNKTIIIDSIEIINDNYAPPDFPDSIKAVIKKAAAAGVLQSLQVKENEAKTLTLNLSKLLPALDSPKTFGVLGYSIGSVSDSDGVLDAAPSIEASNTLTVKVKATASANQIATIPVIVSSSNYADFIVNVTVTIVGNIPLITAQPFAPSQTIYSEDTVTLSVTADSTMSMQYLWYSNTANTTAGGTAIGAWTTIGTGTKTVTFDPPTDKAGLTYYYCEIKNNSGISVTGAVGILVNERTYEAFLTPVTGAYGSARFNYLSPAAKTFTIKSNANQKLKGLEAILNKGVSSEFEIIAVNGKTIDLSTLPATGLGLSIDDLYINGSNVYGVKFGDLNVSGIDSLSLRPKNGLSVGSYTEMLKVTYKDMGADGATETTKTLAASLSFTVTAADGGLTILDPDASGAITYSGSAVTPVVLANTSNGAISWYYRAGGTLDTVDSDGDGVDDTFLLGTPVNAGTWEVVAKAEATANYQAAISNKVSFVIGKKAYEDSLSSEAEVNLYMDITEPTPSNRSIIRTSNTQSIVLTKAPEGIAGLIFTGSPQALIETGAAIGGTLEYAIVPAATGTTNIPAEGDYSSDIPVATIVGDYVVYYRIKAGINHYSVTDAGWKINVNIGKAPAIITADPTDAKSSYTGAEQTLIKEGVTSHGSFVYWISDGTTDPANAAYESALPKATNANTYEVWYKVKGDLNHEDSTPKKVNATIKKSKQAALALSGTLPAAYRTSYTMTVGGGSGTGVYTMESSDPGVASITIVDAAAGKFKVRVVGSQSEYYVTYGRVGDTNYHDASADSVRIDTGKENSVVDTPPSANLRLVYNAASQTLIRAGAASGGSMVYAIGTDSVEPENEMYSDELPTAMEAGEYAIWYKVKGDGGHNDSVAAYIKVEIAKTTQSAISISGKLPSAALGEEHITVTGGSGTGLYTLISSDPLVAEVEVINAAAGSFKVKIVGVNDSYKLIYGRDSDNNYEPIFAETASVGTIKKDAVITKAPAANNIVYNGKPLNLVSAGIGDGGTIVYYLEMEKNALSADSLNAVSTLPEEAAFGPEIPKGTEAGVYTVWYMVEADSLHNDTTPQSLTVTIAKAKQAPIKFNGKNPSTLGSIENITISGGSGSGIYMLVSSDPTVAKVTIIDAVAGTFRVQILIANAKYKLIYGKVGDTNFATVSMETNEN
jgi:hypothetical protein